MSCWWGLIERLALRVLSSRAESFRGSICFISAEAERRGRREETSGARGRERNINKRQTEPEGDLIVKFDYMGKLETLLDISEV